MNRNYQKELERILEKEENKGKKLLLHSCCAPCSSYVLTYLRSFFEITVFYYNPNITYREEYDKRVAEQIRLIEALNQLENGFSISYVIGDYETDLFFDTVKGHEKDKEGGERCFLCYKLRLEKTAELAKEQKADYFTTTLSISPLKNAVKINEIGEELGQRYGVAHLPSDFKKKEGYKKSVELSKEYDLYRQNYCGCVFSKMDSERRENS